MIERRRHQRPPHVVSMDCYGSVADKVWERVMSGKLWPVEKVKPKKEKSWKP